VQLVLTYGSETCSLNENDKCCVKHAGEEIWRKTTQQVRELFEESEQRTNYINSPDLVADKRGGWSM
jgi:hypothetical protein